MADTSSDDDLPLAQRPLGGFGLAAAANRIDSSDSDSDFPSWLQAGAAAGQKGKQVVNLTDSDSDDAVLSPAKPAAAPLPAAQPAGNRDVQQPATQQQTDTKATGAKAAAPTKSAPKHRATPRGRAAGPTAAAAAEGEEAGPSQQPATQPPPSQAPATQPAGGTAQKRAPAVGLPHVPTSSMPVVLPERLPQIKMLVELESNPDDPHGVTDLSGDSGAIGRLIVGGGKDNPQMQVDLKGVLYNATIVPCPVTLAVINMGQAEAKVECLFSEFVQLREDTRFSFVDTDLGGMVGGDDDDDYYAGGPGGDDGAGAGAGEGAAKKGRGKAAAAGKAGGKAKAAPRKRAAPKATGGVKKAAGKPKAKPKPKAAAKKK